ncbi:hypothetical protein CK230_31110 [Mesorhizobium sp. WSM3859]|nr:hypothetical protein CK230_31110 [Mesorhizobium sp. WSM3859]
METPAGQHPPLPCQASPPQGGRLAVTAGFANLQRRPLRPPSLRPLVQPRHILRRQLDIQRLEAVLQLV